MFRRENVSQRARLSRGKFFFPYIIIFISFFVIPYMIKTNTLLKTKVPIAHICYHLKIQSSLLAFEQKRLHQLGNSSDGKYVFVFLESGWHISPIKVLCMTLKCKIQFSMWLVFVTVKRNQTLWNVSRVEHLCVCDEARQCHLLITIWTDWFAITGAVSIFHLLYDVNRKCGSRKFCILKYSHNN